MLLKNGQKINGKELPTLKKRMVFELTEEYSHRDTINQRTVKTANFGIPTTYTMFDKEANESVEIRFADSEQIIGVGPKAERKYMPHKIYLKNGLLVIEKDQPELAYFMLNHPNAEGSESGQKVKFRLVDNVKIATEKMKAETMEVEAKSLIIGSRALDGESLKRVLISYNEGYNVEDMEQDEINAILMDKAKAEPEKFITYAKSSDLEYKVLIHDATEAGYIEYDNSTSKWIWGAKTGNDEGSVIVAVPNGRDAHSWLIEWLTKTDSNGTLKAIQSFVLSKKGKAKASKA